MTDPTPAAILLADDSEPHRSAYARVLRQAGYRVVEAATAAEAWWHATEARPDLVILDVNLPDESGLEVARRLKADPATEAIPILHLSATAGGAEDVVAGLESGDAYLAEPVAPAVLLAQVRALLRMSGFQVQVVREREEAERRAQQLSVVSEELQVANEELEAANEELHISHDELEQQQALLQSIIDGTPGIVSVKDRSGRFVTVNTQAEKVFGLSRDQIRDRTDYDLFPNEVAERSREHDWRVLDTGVPQQVEEALELADGRHVFIANKFPLRDGKGEIFAVCSISTDITERVRMEEALRRQAELLDLSHEAIFTWEWEGAIVSWNRGAEELYGYTREEAVGRVSHDLLKTEHPQGLPRVVAGLEAHQVWGGELTHTTKGGRTITVEARLQLIREASGRQVVLESNRDVTERRRAEEALAASHRQVQSIINNTPAIVYAFDLEERFVMANTAVADLLNSTPEQMIGKRRQEFMPKEDADWHEANDRQVIEAGRALEFEEHSQLNGRSITWLTTKFPLRDAQGRVYAVAGISADISERKQAEEALRESEERFARIFEKAAYPMSLARRADGVLVDVNEAWVETFGFTRQEAVGKTTTELRIHRDPEARARALAEMQQQDPLYRWEVTLFTKSGEPRLFSNSLGVVVLGQEQYLLSTAEDITERRRAEEALRESEAHRQSAEAMAAERHRFLEMLDTLPLILDIIRADHRIEWTNRAYREALGDNTGCSCFGSQFGREEPCEECQAFTPLRTGQPHHWEWTLPNGRTFDIHNFPFTAADGSPAVLEMDIDITERRAAEAELARHREHLEELVADRTAQLQAEIEERKQAEEQVRKHARELAEANEDLARFNRAAVGRELRMIELKQQVNALCQAAGKPARYSLESEEEGT